MLALAINLLPITFKMNINQSTKKISSSLCSFAFLNRILLGFKIIVFKSRLNEIKDEASAYYNYLKKQLSIKTKFFSGSLVFMLLICQMVGVLFLLVQPTVVEATDMEVKFVPQVTIPGSDNKFVAGKPITEQNGTMIALYIQAWYNFVIAAVGILATTMIMVGGLIWLTAGGSATRISQAKEWIFGAVIGLVLAMMSYTLLDILDPNLVTFQSLDIGSVSNTTINTVRPDDLCGGVKCVASAPFCSSGQCVADYPAECRGFSTCEDLGFVITSLGCTKMPEMCGWKVFCDAKPDTYFGVSGFNCTTSKSGSW